MKTAALLLLFALITSIVSTAQAQQFRGTPITLDMLGIVEVVSGPPKLTEEFKGRVVVIGLSSFPELKRPSFLSASSDSEKRRILREEEKQIKERLKEKEEFLKDFEKFYAQLSSHPNLRCALNFNTEAMDSPRTMAARQLKMHYPVVLSLPAKLAERQTNDIPQVGSISVFDAQGILIYTGKIGNDGNKAIREALKSVQP